ncbi:hypothetical protein ACFX2I_012761 [Malus domestica]
MCVNLHAPCKADWQKCPTFNHIRENIPNEIACSKIEEAPLPKSREPNFYQDDFLKNQRGTTIRLSRARLTTGLLARLSESREPDSQQDCFLKNRRGTALQISRARLPTRLLSQKSKRHCYPNLKSQILDKIACSKTEEAPLSELREPDFLG